MTATIPTFSAFYRAVHGFDPFPWQDRLAQNVAATERWPLEIGVPTGLGKTASFEIAMWWLASQADRPPAERTAPTRIWWVVNRRLLVDSTAQQAESLARQLCKAGSGETPDDREEVLRQVAERLRSLSADRDAPPLEVITLRGSIAAHTPTDPSRPTLIFCTLPMYGSRLLFRGYGSSLRAVDAAMAGTDSLVLLDEAHLAPHLRSLVLAAGECEPSAPSFLPAARSDAKVVALTATGEAIGADRFDLDEDDECNDIVRQRLDAVKPMRLQVESGGDIGKHLAHATADLLDAAAEPASFVVFANSPRTARDIYSRLRDHRSKGKPAAEVVLLTGRTREREAERIRARILDPASGIAAGRPSARRECHLVVIATQTLEVGADIDAEYLVTEACGVRALTQRLGRLNRRGSHPHARAVYVHVPPARRVQRGGHSAPQSWPVYGEEPDAVLDRLQQQAERSGGGTIHLSPRCVARVLGPPCDDPGRAPEILPGILWEWIKTTTPPEGEAPVEPYFTGVSAPEYAVSVIWRIHVPKAGDRLWPRATDHEAVDVPLTELREALTEDEAVHRLEPDGVTVEAVTPVDLRPGNQILLGIERGLLDESGWDPAATGPVVDVSLMRSGLPLDAPAIERLCGAAVHDSVAKVLSNDDDLDVFDRRKAIDQIVDAVRDAGPPAGWDTVEWVAFLDSLEPRFVQARREVPRLPSRNASPERRIGEFDETSLGDTVELESHGRAVGVHAGAVAERLGLSENLRDIVSLAGTLHDIGKADPRFQRWLDPAGAAAVPMAKSSAPRHRWESMRAAAGWPRGGRHEDLSARLVCAWLDRNPDWGTPTERDLLIHLVISHHGKGRPLLQPVHDGTSGTVAGCVSGVRVEVAADLSTTDWDQPARFRRLNRHFGPWGLALLESIVIRSDHAVSARGDVELEMP